MRYTTSSSVNQQIIKQYQTLLYLRACNDIFRNLGQIKSQLKNPSSMVDVYNTVTLEKSSSVKITLNLMRCLFN